MDRESAAAWSLDAASGSERAVGCVVGQAAKTTVRELRLGSLTLTDVAVYVVDLSHVNAELEKQGAGRIDGVIGADIMDHRQAVIAYARRTLHLKVS